MEEESFELGSEAKKMEEHEQSCEGRKEGSGELLVSSDLCQRKGVVGNKAGKEVSDQITEDPRCQPEFDLSLIANETLKFF